MFYFRILAEIVFYQNLKSQSFFLISYFLNNQKEQPLKSLKLKLLENMDKHQVRQFSPIGEEPILEEGTAHCFNYTTITSTPSSSTLKTATPKKYNLRPKRFSSSTPKTPKMSRYSSCSNIQEWVELGKFLC